MQTTDRLKSRIELLDYLNIQLSTFNDLQTVEIGVYRGAFSQCILDVLKPSKHYMIDSWSNFHNQSVKPSGEEYNYSQDYWDEIYQFNVDNYGSLPNVEIIKAKSLDAVKKFANNSLHFVYIDADYHSLYSDIVAWLPKIVSGGIIAGAGYRYSVENNNIPSVRYAVERAFVSENYFVTDEPNHIKQWFHYKI